MYIWNATSINHTILSSKASEMELFYFKQIRELNENIKWSDFYLLLNGKKYYSKFKDEIEWMNYYNKKRE